MRPQYSPRGGRKDSRHEYQQLFVCVTGEIRLWVHPLSPWLLNDAKASVWFCLVQSTKLGKVYLTIYECLEGRCNLVGMIMTIFMGMACVVAMVVMSMGVMVVRHV